MQVFRNAFKPIFGKPCWKFQRGYASFLTMEFGEPHLMIRNPKKIKSNDPQRKKHWDRRHIYIRGNWHLWIHMSHWEAFSNGKLIGTGDDDNEVIDEVANELDGQKLVSVQIIRKNIQTIFEFDLGGRLEVLPYTYDEKLTETWYLFEPSGYVLTLRSDGYYSYAPGNSVDEDHWQEIQDTHIKYELWPPSSYIK